MMVGKRVWVNLIDENSRADDNRGREIVRKGKRGKGQRGETRSSPGRPNQTEHTNATQTICP